MFGYVIANWGELTQDQQQRYRAVYCGICRSIRRRTSQTAGLGLSYDMAFLGLLLMSLYEPEEQTGDRACMLHPIKGNPYVENDALGYCADMNVALAYYNFLDDWQDDKKLSAGILAAMLKGKYPRIQEAWPRQCKAIETCLQTLGELEKAGCGNPDLPANAFGELMGELCCWKEDFWAPTLRELGRNLGRFIYLLDAVMDYEQDLRKGSYNPLRLLGCDRKQWETYLVLAMARCAECYERLPLVQDKALLDNILYSGVWVAYREREKKEGHKP